MKRFAWGAMLAATIPLLAAAEYTRTGPVRVYYESWGGLLGKYADTDEMAINGRRGDIPVNWNDVGEYSKSGVCFVSTTRDLGLPSWMGLAVESLRGTYTFYWKGVTVTESAKQISFKCKKIN